MFQHSEQTSNPIAIGTFRIRPLIVADVSSVIEIAEKCRLERWTEGDYADEILRQDSLMLGLEHSGNLVAFLAARVVPSSTGPHFDAELYNIGVTPESQRKGLGYTLINHLKTVCVNRSLKSIWLEVRSRNNPAMRFYEGHGFKSAGTRKNAYEHPLDDAVIMHVELE